MSYLYSPYSKVDRHVLLSAEVEGGVKRLDYAAIPDDGGSSLAFIGQEANFAGDLGVDIISECGDNTLDQKYLVQLDGAERIFTDAVPYIRTSSHPIEDITYAVPSQQVDEKYVTSLQIDVYRIPEIKKTATGGLQDTMGISLGSDKERNRSLRVTVFGKATVRYDTLMFSKLFELINKCVESKNIKTKFNTIGVNVNDAPTINKKQFDGIIDIDWGINKICAWPKCLRSVGVCYVISTNTTGSEDIFDRIVLKPDEKYDILKKIYDTAVASAKSGCQAIESYDLQSSIALQMAEQAKWALKMGVSLVMETCGINVGEKPFEMVDVDVECFDESKLRIASIDKGDGLPMISSKAWDAMFPPDCLKGISRSPIAVATTILFNYIEFGNEAGELMAPVDNLNFHDYAAESRSEVLKKYLSGVAKKAKTTMKHMTPLYATSTLGNILGYEVIRAKCRVEEASRLCSQVNKRMAVWKDIRTMLHFRVVDGALLKMTPFTMLTADEMDVVGFVPMSHDAIDLGYDLSVKESGNTFLTLTNGKIDVDSVKKGYIRIANGVQYILEKYRYDAVGLALLATHFWHLGNGRHRLIPSMYNGSCQYSHIYLQLEGGLIDALNGKSSGCKTSTGASQAAEEIRNAGKLLGPDAVAIADIITVDIANTYAENVEVSDAEVLEVERKLCELTTSLSFGCDVDGKMTSFLWMIFEYMFLKTGMMLSCVLGTLKIARNRRQSDDRGGLGYKKWL